MLRRRPDDDDVAGVEDRLQRADSTGPITQVGVVLQEIVGGQVEMDVHGAVLEPAAVDQPDVTEHALHADVVRECLRHQSRNPASRAIPARSSTNTVAMPSW